MTIFKELGSQDAVSTKTLLHEAIPITGSILSGTYGTFPNGGNIKNYSHGMFQSVYDYPYLSSSANHIFDISFGVSTVSSLAVTKQTAKKNNIYNQMAQVLMGYDKDGNIQRFDEDGNLTGGTKIDECVFLTFSRLLVKDEIAKGTFEIELGLSSSYSSSAAMANNNMNGRAVVKDYGAATSYKVNSPVGEYGILYVSNSAGQFDKNCPVKGNPNFTTNKVACGLIFYQAGVVALSSSLFMSDTVDGGLLSASVDLTGRGGETIAQRTNFSSSLKTVEISASADGLRKRIKNIQFNNTIELNSTIYFCRMNHNEFNYSGNPTYLSGSQIRVKNTTTDMPISYITTVGLYSADNQLLAVGKLSEPIRKDNNIELTFRARLDY